MKKVKNIALKYLDNIDVYIKKDLNHLDRFVIIVSKSHWQTVIRVLYMLYKLVYLNNSGGIRFPNDFYF